MAKKNHVTKGFKNINKEKDFFLKLLLKYLGRRKKKIKNLLENQNEKKEEEMRKNPEKKEGK